jgi:hypothetical protein
MVIATTSFLIDDVTGTTPHPGNPTVTVRKRPRHHALTVAVLAATLMTLAGCGASSGDSRDEVARADDCLRAAGIVPSTTGPGSLPVGMTPTQLLAMLMTCGVRTGRAAGQVEAGVTSAAKRAMVERELVKQVTCLQGHGFQVTVPRNIEEKLFNADGVDTRSARFRAAERECRQKFVEAVRTLGPGYGPEGSTDTGGAGSVTKTAYRSPSQRVTLLATCVHKYGGTVAQTGTLVGLRVPSHMPVTQLTAMLKKCYSGSSKREGRPKQ